MPNLLDRLHTSFGDRVVPKKNISPYLTLRTNVTAELYLELRSREDWLTLASLLRTESIPFFMLGGGSNVAIVSEKIPGLVVRNAYQERHVIAQTDTSVDMQISSGYSVTRLAKETAEEGLSGFEYHLGLPGTVGGGIFMNSKWTKPDSYLGDNLVGASLMDRKGVIKEVDQNYFDFSYGYSKLQDTKELLIDATFRLTKMDPTLLTARAKESMAYRSETQPKGQFTTGCFFKNISEEERERIHAPTKSAGYLIDQAGLKLTEQGDYYVSEKHANFIMNRGNGQPADLRLLVDRIKRQVADKFGIELREEVIIM